MKLSGIALAHLGDQIPFIQLDMLTPSNLGVFEEQSQEIVVEALNDVRLTQFIKIKNRDEYDNWFDEQVVMFHLKLMPYYKKDIRIKKQHAFTYSARLLTKYLKSCCFGTFLFDHDGEFYIEILHPVISDAFLHAFPKLEIKSVEEIQGREHYYLIVEYYRYLMATDLSYENLPLLKLEVIEEW